MLFTSLSLALRARALSYGSTLGSRVSAIIRRKTKRERGRVREGELVIERGRE